MSKRGIPDCPRLSDRDGYGDADVDKYFGRESSNSETISITREGYDIEDVKREFHKDLYSKEDEEEFQNDYKKILEECRPSQTDDVNININLNISVDPTDKNSIKKLYEFIDNVKERYEYCNDKDEEDDEED